VLLSSIFFASVIDISCLLNAASPKKLGSSSTAYCVHVARRKSILDNKKLILSFLNAVEAQAKYTLEVGGYVEGYKLVEGSPRATWTQCALDELPNFLGDAAFNKQLISITDAKNRFSLSVTQRLRC
jgi:hypothetical protein